MAKKLQNLREKVYLLTYMEPNYYTKISKILYGQEKKQVLHVINELKEKNWIREKNFKKGILQKDGRSIVGRKYYVASIDPLFDSILLDLRKSDRSLSKEEQKKLKYLLESEKFRNAPLPMITDDEVRDRANVLSLIKNTLAAACIFYLFIKDLYDELDDPNIKISIAEEPLKSIVKLGEPLMKKLAFIDLNTLRILNTYLSKLVEIIAPIGFPLFLDSLQKKHSKKNLKKIQ